MIKMHTTKRFVSTRHLRGHQCKNTIRGSILVEMALYLIIASILLVAQATSIRSDLENQISTATGQYLVQIQSGINLYQSANDVVLKQTTPTITGFVNPLQPTTAELIAKNYLPTGFSTVSPNGLSFKHELNQVNCPGVSCTITGLSYSTTGYRDVGNIMRADLLAIAVAKIGVDGSQSLPVSGGTLTGYAGSYSVANPAGNVAGTLAIRIGDMSGFSALLAQFYKLDGSRSLTGNMNVNGNDLNNIQNLTSTALATLTDVAISNKLLMSGSAAPGAACVAGDSSKLMKSTTGDGLVICNNLLWEAVGSAVSGITVGGACTLKNQLGTDPRGVAFLCNGSVWSNVSTYANAGEVCAPAGRVAVSSSTNEQLVCKGGQYLKLTSLLTKNVQVGQHLAVKDGDIIVKPICDIGGIANYSLTLTQSAVDVSIAPPYQSTYVAASNNGATWTILLRLKKSAADGGTEVSGNTYGISAVMTLECTY